MQRDETADGVEEGETTVFQSHNTTVFPVHMYQVSEGWVLNVFNEFKRAVISQAIKCQCPQDFIASINDLSLVVQNNSSVEIVTQKSELIELSSKASGKSKSKPAALPPPSKPAAQRNVQVPDRATPEPATQRNAHVPDAAMSSPAAPPPPPRPLAEPAKK